MKASQLLGKYYSDTIPDTELSGVYSDTRQMKPGGVFVCIIGEKEDGHRYARRAEELGAQVIIAARHIMCGVPVILTEDTHGALVYLISRFYGEPKLKLMGVTGTNGKTSASYLIAGILAAAGEKCGVIGTNGIFLDDEELPVKTTTPTTPSLCELRTALHALEAEGAGWAVMEVTSHALVQRRVEGLHFEAGVFTNLTQDHLDYHNGMEEYFAAKMRLFEQCSNGAVNTDDEYGRRILKKYPDFISYGTTNQTVAAKDISYHSSGAEFTMVLGEQKYPQKINLPGSFSVYNALAAAAAAYSIGIDASSISRGLSRVHGVEGRMERIDINKPYEVIIDYAHTPDGLLKVLEAVRGITKGRVICVFGCGGDRDRTKRGVMGAIAVRLCDIAIITSDNPRTEPPTEIIIDILSGVRSDNYIVIENRKKAIKAALAMAQEGDTVLLAGKGQERYQIIGREKIPFDEREIVRKEGY